MIEFKHVLAAHLFCCFFLTGLIWTIQLVHYPAFKFIDEKKFTQLHLFHSRGISFVVMPLMTLEMLTGIVLVFIHKKFYFEFICLVGVWMSTAFLSVPLHQQLASGYELKKIQKLVLTNWPRTLLWTIRSILFFPILLHLDLLT